jgi:hypothetical protein
MRNKGCGSRGNGLGTEHKQNTESVQIRYQATIRKHITDYGDLAYAVVNFYSV